MMMPLALGLVLMGAGWGLGAGVGICCVVVAGRDSVGVVRSVEGLFSVVGVAEPMLGTPMEPLGWLPFVPSGSRTTGGSRRTSSSVRSLPELNPSLYASA